MSKHWMSEIKSLGQLRDELRLKAHLLRADLKAEMDRLETQWQRLDREIQPVKDAAAESAKELGESTKQLLKSLQHGYERIGTRCAVPPDGGAGARRPAATGSPDGRHAPRGLTAGGRAPALLRRRGRNACGAQPDMGVRTPHRSDP